MAEYWSLQCTCHGTPTGLVGNKGRASINCPIVRNQRTIALMHTWPHVWQLPPPHFHPPRPPYNRHLNITRKPNTPRSSRRQMHWQAQTSLDLGLPMCSAIQKVFVIHTRAQDACRSSVVTLHKAKITGKFEQSGWTI